MTDPRHDHFALFDLPPRFAIDEASLEQAYRRVQAQVHPVRFAAAGAAERRVAMQWAARANEAFMVQGVEKPFEIGDDEEKERTKERRKCGA